MEERVSLKFFENILRDGLRYGANYLVEFEPQSLWHETSVTLCADALRKGVRTDYHTFTHSPDDIRAQLMRMGISVGDLEASGALRILDSFTVQSGIGQGEQAGKQTTASVNTNSLKMSDWDKFNTELLSGEVSPDDQFRLHIDDDTSVLFQYNDEGSVVEHFRTQTSVFARRLKLAAIHSLKSGTYSDSIYRRFESFCDGVFDFRTKEEDRVVQLARARFVRGESVDTSWRELGVSEVGEVVPREAKGFEGSVGERRLAAIMFTDMVGFTGMAQRNESLAMDLLAEQRSMMRPLFARHRGREVKTIGDAFLVEFASASEAVRCAVEVQEMLAIENARRPEERKIVIRIGVHLGDVIHSHDDVAGDAVNVASRIEPLAPPGGVSVSGQVYESVVNKVGCEFESIGTPKLKNVAIQMQIYRVAGLGQSTPPPQVSALPDDRIAVLPFSNISKDTSDEYFADGMTEELISVVSKTKGLKVIARTSVMKYKGAQKTVAEIGKELNVGSVLEGSVRKAGDKVRITVQLIDTSREEPRWSEEYDRDLSDVFAIQADIADRVAGALQLEFLGRHESQGKHVPPTEAYVEYLRGRQLWNLRTKDGLGRSIEHFESSLAKDPAFAKAYSGLADSYATLALLEFMAPRDAFPKAKGAVGMALSLDEGLAEAHTSLGLIRFQYDWDWKGAEDELRRAISINPNYAPAHHFYADYLKAMGRFEEALTEISKARDLDPLSLAISAGVGHVLYLSKEYDRAIEQYEKAVELDPQFMLTHVWFGRPYLEKGMYSEALRELQAGVRLSGEGTLALGMLGHGLGSAGKRDEAMQVLRKLEERSVKEYVPSYWIAVVYNGLREKDEVLRWLRRAYDERSSWLVWANVEPRFDWLRGDPGFASLMEEMGFLRPTVK